MNRFSFMVKDVSQLSHYPVEKKLVVVPVVTWSISRCFKGALIKLIMRNAISSPAYTLSAVFVHVFQRSHSICMLWGYNTSNVGATFKCWHIALKRKRVTCGCLCPPCLPVLMNLLLPGAPEAFEIHCSQRAAALQALHARMVPITVNAVEAMNST